MATHDEIEQDLHRSLDQHVDDFVVPKPILDSLSKELEDSAKREAYTGKADIDGIYVSKLLSALSHPDRLQLVKLLLRHEQLSVAELVDSLGLRQPAVSQHLSRLRELDVIKSHRRGKSVYCSVSDPRIAKLIEKLDQLFSVSAPDSN